jgi:hypothetical protein
MYIVDTESKLYDFNGIHTIEKGLPRFYLFTSTGCKTGWTPYQGQCYKVFEEEVDRTTAATRCLSQNNAMLASSKNLEANKFLRSLV